MYQRVTWRNADSDIPSISLEHWAYYDNAEELAEALERGDEEAEIVLTCLRNQRKRRAREKLPHDKVIAKELAISLMNTMITINRVTPFRDSALLLDRYQALEILQQYPAHEWNPLAYMFPDASVAYYSIITDSRQPSKARSIWEKSINVSRTFLFSFFLPADRKITIDVFCYSPLVWWLLKLWILTDEYVTILRPLVSAYIAKELARRDRIRKYNNIRLSN